MPQVANTLIEADSDAPDVDADDEPQAPSNCVYTIENGPLWQTIKAPGPYPESELLLESIEVIPTRKRSTVIKEGAHHALRAFDGVQSLDV